MVKEVKYRKENYTYEEEAVTTLEYSCGNGNQCCRKKVLEYSYDEAGYQITASEDGVVTRYKTFGGYRVGPYGGVYKE